MSAITAKANPSLPAESPCLLIDAASPELIGKTPDGVCEIEHFQRKGFPQFPHRESHYEALARDRGLRVWMSMISPSTSDQSGRAGLFQYATWESLDGED